MIDYQKIAAGDPGGDLHVAFATMAAETVQVLRDVDGRMLSARGVYGLIGQESGKKAMDAIKVSMADEDIKAWFSPDQGGIDSLLVGPTFDQLAASSVITQAEADFVKAYAYEEQPKYHGLTVAQLEKARMKKARGDFNG